MDDGMSKRPWWRKKRWIGAGLLGLAVLYPLSFGAVLYANGRGWISETAIQYVAFPYMPIMLVAEAVPPLGAVIEPCVYGCLELGQRHSGIFGSPEFVLPPGFFVGPDGQLTELPPGMEPGGVIIIPASFDEPEPGTVVVPR